MFEDLDFTKLKLPIEPKNLIYTVRHLSKIKGVSEESVSKFTSNNFFKLFNIRNG